MNAVTAVSGSGPAYVCYWLERLLNNAIYRHCEGAKRPKQSQIWRLLRRGYASPRNDNEYVKFLAEFKNAAKAVGFNSKEADFLVNNTFKCTLNVLKKTKIKPAVLRKQVTSKGGTTEAALKVLIRGGSLKTAAKVALKRAKQLSRG